MDYARPLLIVGVAGLVLLPHSVSAGGRRGAPVVVVAPGGTVVVARPGPKVVHPGPRVLVRPKSVFPVAADPWRFWGVPGVSPRPFFPTVVASAPVSTVYTSIVYATPPPVYSPPAPVAVPDPAPLPIPSLIEYPTGWYQLRGDGVTTRYVWVWIPKPPAPPAAPAPTPPAVPPADAPPAPPERSPARQTDLFRWVDDDDVVHWTDRLQRVPERYRSRVQRRS